MKLKLKLMAAAVALVAASGANATIINSQAGNGELFFTIYDIGADDSSNVDDRAYARDLGSLLNGGRINDWVSAITTAPLPALNADKQGFGTIYSVAADANLASFLSASTDTSRLRWNIAASDTHGTDRLLITANSVVAPIYTAFRNFGSSVDIYLPVLNPALPGNVESALYFGADAGLNLYGDNLAGRAEFSNAAGLGGSLGFFVLSERIAAGSPVAIADVRQFMADATTPMQWTLANDGTLSYGALAPVPAIPEPSEYALMLAGLGMLGFMARRRLGNRV